MFAHADPSPKMHGHLRMPSTPRARDGSRRYRIFRARRQMHEHLWKCVTTRTEWAVAATPPVKPVKRGYGRMLVGISLCLPPHWPSELTHRRQASSWAGASVYQPAYTMVYYCILLQGCSVEWCRRLRFNPRAWGQKSIFATCNLGMYPL